MRTVFINICFISKVFSFSCGILFNFICERHSSVNSCGEAPVPLRSPKLFNLDSGWHSNLWPLKCWCGCRRLGDQILSQKESNPFFTREQGVKITLSTSYNQKELHVILLSNFVINKEWAVVYPFRDIQIRNF